MTIKEYMSQKLQAFNVTEAQLLDITLEENIDLEDEADDMTPRDLGIMMIHSLENVLFAPRLKSVSESGFSMSFHYEDATKYYLYLCRKWGITPVEELLSGINTIIDKSTIW